MTESQFSELYQSKGLGFIRAFMRIRYRSRVSIQQVRQAARSRGLRCHCGKALFPMASFRHRPRRAVYYAPIVPPPTAPARRWVDRVLMCEI